MERLKLKYEDALRAHNTLEEIFKESFSLIIRDAAIQRFEYTFEALWKCVKEYLKEKEGIIANSPKACFREIFTLGLLTEDETITFLEMTDRRNDTSHTYKEEIAQKIYNELKGYSMLIKRLLSKFSATIP